MSIIALQLERIGRETELIPAGGKNFGFSVASVLGFGDLISTAGFSPSLSRIHLDFPWFIRAVGTSGQIVAAGLKRMRSLFVDPWDV